MSPFLSLSRRNWAAEFVAVCCSVFLCHDALATDFAEVLQVLGRVDAGADSQVEAQRAWQVVTTDGTIEQLPEILTAMKDAGPLANNWLRAASDTIAERELRDTGSLPEELLEKFALDLEQAPLARRIAYEWLTKVDATASERLLPNMLDDPSLELRYDAISSLFVDAEAADDKQSKLKKYQRALRSARDLTQLKTCAEALKKMGQTPDMPAQLGYLTQWKVIGPFDNSGRTGFDTAYPPESEIDFAAEYAGKHGPVKWEDIASERENLKSLGMVDLNAVLAEEKSVLAYAFATFVLAEDLQVECRYESVEATKLWVNGKEVAAKNVYHSGDGFDQYIVPCQFNRGENRILIKVCQNEQTQSWTKPWEIRLRITDNLGGAIPQAKILD